MKRGAITLLSVGGSLIFAVGAAAVATENPYQSIIERNVFALKPPPPPTDTMDPTKQPPPTMFLTGITTVFGNKRALLKSAPAPAKPGDKPVEQTYMLTEGQRDGDVEVVQIDERNGVVKIRLAGKEMDLDFDRNGVKITAAPPPAPAPGAPGALPGFPLRPAGAASPAPPAMAQPGSPGFRSSSTMPSRTLRLPGSTVAGTTSTGYGTGYGTAYGTGYGTIATPGATTVGSINLGGYSSGTTTAAQTTTPQQTVSPEEQLAVMAAEALANKNNPKYPPPPPPVSQVIGGDTATTQSQSQNTGSTQLPQMPPMPGRPIPLTQ